MSIKSVRRLICQEFEFKSITKIILEISKILLFSLARISLTSSHTVMSYGDLSDTVHLCFNQRFQDFPFSRIQVFSDHVL